MNNEYSETDLAYLAGLIDGEGCLTIDGRKSGNRTCYVGRLVIAMTGETVNDLRKRYGIGAIHKGKPRKPNHRPLSYWSIAKFQLHPLLKLLLPYLVVKKAQATTLLELFHLQATFGRGEVDYRWLFDVIRKLNKRGA